MPRTFTTETPLEALVVEQALLLARQVQQAADAAADGKVLSAVEGAAVPAARELARRAVEAALQQQAAPAEKSWPAGRSRPPSRPRPQRPKKATVIRVKRKSPPNRPLPPATADRTG
jgi:hypothetical protein